MFQPRETQSNNTYEKVGKAGVLPCVVKGVKLEKTNRENVYKPVLVFDLDVFTESESGKEMTVNCSARMYLPIDATEQKEVQGRTVYPGELNSWSNKQFMQQLYYGFLQNFVDSKNSDGIPMKDYINNLVIESQEDLYQMLEATIPEVNKIISASKKKLYTVCTFFSNKKGDIVYRNLRVFVPSRKTGIEYYQYYPVVHWVGQDTLLNKDKVTPKLGEEITKQFVPDWDLVETSEFGEDLPF